MHAAVALMQWIGVVGCGCPGSRKVSPMILAYFDFSNSALSSSSAANSVIYLSIWHTVNIAPLSCMW